MPKNERIPSGEVLDEATGLVANKDVRCLRSGVACAAKEWDDELDAVFSKKRGKREDKIAAHMHIIYGIALQLDTLYGRFEYGVEVLYGRAAKAGLLHNYISEITGNRAGKYFRSGSMVVDLMLEEGQVVDVPPLAISIYGPDANGEESSPLVADQLAEAEHGAGDVETQPIEGEGSEETDDESAQDEVAQDEIAQDEEDQDHDELEAAAVAESSWDVSQQVTEAQVH